jgi:uncharacterized membrane protein YqjE
MIETEQTHANGVGIFGTVRRLGSTAVAILQNRLELLALELKEEKGRVTSLIAWGAALVFLVFLGFVALMFTLSFIFWEQRVAVMGGFCGFFFVGAIGTFLILKGKLKTPPFAETITQLKKDREWLQRR